jgi:protein involved in polysaccharide export with SLBB domain
MRLIHNYMRSFLSAGIICSLALFLTGCATNSTNSSASAANSSSSTIAQEPVDPRTDPLQAGDRIEVDLNPGSGIQIPSVVSDIKGDGSINLPEIGRIDAAGKTPGELEKAIQAKYVPAIYARMAVTVTATVRYFFVGGEINQNGNGGRIAYTGPITVTQAIRSAGDFNPFAAKKKVQLRRSITGKTFIVNCVKAIDHPELDLPVYPGDTIFVPRRFW